LTQYLVIGRAPGDRGFLPPYNLITSQIGVGSVVDLTLSGQDEATLESAGIIVPAASVGHLFPQ
jgi:hypothetical protein